MVIFHGGGRGRGGGTFHRHFCLWLHSHRPPVCEKNASDQCGKFETTKNAERHRCRGFHISHDLQLLIDSGDAGALAALSDHTADTDGWDDEFLPGYASGASDDGDLF